MTSRLPRFAALLTLGVLATPAAADLCDYRLSRLAGAGASAARDAVTPERAVRAGALGLTHAATGAQIAGSVGSAVGGSGAAAALATPPGMIVGGLAVIGAGGTEAYCHFRPERITDYDAVLAVLTEVARDADPSRFALETPESGFAETAHIVITADDGEVWDYEVRNLYIVDGVLKHRDRGRDTVIGNLNLRVDAAEVDAPSGSPTTDAGPDDAGPVEPAPDEVMPADVTDDAQSDDTPARD